jgi:hypothetical protein
LAASCAVAKNPANICGHNKVFAFKDQVTKIATERYTVRTSMMVQYEVI